MKLIAYNRCAWHCDIEGCCRISSNDLETRIRCLSFHLHGIVNGLIIECITASSLSTMFASRMPSRD